LEGELGGGKTTFLKGFAKGLGIRKKIKSPTFIIMRKYKLGFRCQVLGLGYFYHFDCYRISKAKEILNLGFKEIIQNPENIVAIEWGDKIRRILPKNYIRIKFRFLGQNKRKITIANLY
jgi:tRNA threonylcarbamoyladenosine biosynthesis protein TsaE